MAGTKPMGCVVMALSTPGFGKPSLLSYNELEELLRMLGKAVAHLVGSRKWAETSGRRGIIELRIYQRKRKYARNRANGFRGDFTKRNMYK